MCAVYDVRITQQPSRTTAPPFGPQGAGAPSTADFYTSTPSVDDMLARKELRAPIVRAELFCAASRARIRQQRAPGIAPTRTPDQNKQKPPPNSSVSPAVADHQWRLASGAPEAKRLKSTTKKVRKSAPLGWFWFALIRRTCKRRRHGQAPPPSRLILDAPQQYFWLTTAQRAWRKMPCVGVVGESPLPPGDAWTLGGLCWALLGS